MLALDGLVGIGVGTQIDWRTYVTGLAQLLFKYLGGIGLGNQLGFEIEAGGEVPVGMARTGVAVDADVLCYWFHSPRLVKK